MPDISAAQRPKLITATIDLGEGDSLNVSFDRNKVTKDLLERNQADVDFSNVLAELITSWDLTENDQVLAHTPAVLARLSVPVQSAIFKILMREAVPTSEEGNGSSDISSTPSTTSTVPQASPQNGPEPSPSPTPSASPSPT